MYALDDYEVPKIAFFAFTCPLNIFGTKAGICKAYTAFSFFHKILCETSKKSRGKNLIIVAL